MNAHSLLTTNHSGSRDRALVLGGGGSTGNAWIIGVLAGLGDSGVDTARADLVIGTSAGATAAAQLAGASAADLLEDILSAPPPVDPRAGRTATTATRSGVGDHLQRMAALVASSNGPAELRRAIGRAALDRDAAAETPGNPHWRDLVAGRFTRRAWPRWRMLITAIDAETGEPVVFHRESGVDLVDAVAASTSSGLPYGIGGARYLDGAFRRNENADLAAGYYRVLVLSPLGGRSLTPPEWRQHLDAQVQELRSSGSLVETVTPGPEADHLFGAAAMDVSLRPAAARAGYDRGRALGETIAPLWQ